MGLWEQIKKKKVSLVAGFLVRAITTVDVLVCGFPNYFIAFTAQLGLKKTVNVIRVTNG